MVRLVEASDPEGHEGEAAARLAVPFFDLRSRYDSNCPLQHLSSPRRRVFLLLQRQLYLHLAANGRKADVDPRRRPPQAPSAEAILARWLAADPRRLSGGCFSLTLEAFQAKKEVGSTRRAVSSQANRRPAIGTGAGQAGRGGLSEKELTFTSCQRVVKGAPASAPPAAITPQKKKSGSTIRAADPNWTKKSGPFGEADEVPPNASGNRQQDCVLCLTPFTPVGGGFLCTACLLKPEESLVDQAACSSKQEKDRASPPAPFVPRPSGNKRCPQVENCLSPVGSKATRHDGMPKRRRFKRSLSPAPAQVQEQGQQLEVEGDHTDSAAERGKRRTEPGWRSRSTAAAAASAETSSWWGSSLAAGEAPVVPALLLPLLPSVFSLHARPWPPPPAKRRRLISKRERGLACLGAGAKVFAYGEEVLWGPPQPGGSLKSCADICSKERGDGVAVAAAPATSEAAVAAAKIEARSGAAETRELAKMSTAAGKPDSARCCGGAGYSACAGLLIPESLGDSNVASVAQATVIAKGVRACLCCPSPLAYNHEALPRRRRGRPSEPGGATYATDSTARHTHADVANNLRLSTGAVGREIAAAAAAAATLKTEQRYHEQQTPPSRLRRKTWGPDGGACAAAATAASAAATAGVGAPLAAAAASKLTAAPSGIPPSPPQASSAAGEYAVASVATAYSTATSAAAATATTPAPAASAPNANAAACAAPNSINGQDTELEAPSQGLSGSPQNRQSCLARISQGLLVGLSSLGRGSGLGIYSCRDFSRRAVVCEYSGVLIDRSTALLLRRMRCASHVINVQMQHLYLLGFHTPSPLLGGGAFVNEIGRAHV